MIRVLIVGSGNVARQLYRAWQGSTEVVVQGVLSRSRPDTGFEGIPYYAPGTRLPEADVLLIAVSDDAIPQLSRELGNTPALVVHTSGRTPMKALLGQQRIGVFYPLQSFAPGREIDFSTIPICLEAEEKEDLALLRTLGESLGSEIHEVDSEKRARLHLAAVLVNNFTNHLYTLSADLLEEGSLDFSLLLPLIRETTARLEGTNPAALQTGPALRNDRQTMKGHLDTLKDPGTRELYEVLSKSIQAYHGKEL